MSAATRPERPIAMCGGLVSLGVVTAVVGGSGIGAIVGGAIACPGAIPAGVAAWQGMQRETQATLGIGIGALALALGIGGPLIVVGIITAVG